MGHQRILKSMALGKWGSNVLKCNFHYTESREVSWVLPVTLLHRSYPHWWEVSIDSCNTLRWRQNGRDSVSNHQPRDCLFNRLFRRRSKKTSKLRVTGLCVGNSPGPVNSPHKGPVTRKMFPFDDVIMKPLFKSILTHIYCPIWIHWATME